MNAKAEIKENYIKLDTKNTSYIFGVEDGMYLTHYYYGRKLRDGNVAYLSRLHEGNVLPSVNARDKNTFLDFAPFEYPSGGIGDFRIHALEIETEDGATACELKYKGAEIVNGKKHLEGLPQTFGTAEDTVSVEVTLEDKELDLEVVLAYTAFDDIDAIVRSVRVKNNGEKAIYLTKVMSLCLDIDDKDFDILTLNGSWGREKHMDRRALGHGFQGVSSRRGISSHQEHPFMALLSKNATQTEGEVYGFNFIYSGNFEAVAELDQFDKVRAMMGISPYLFKWKLEKGEEFVSPEAVMVYSANGLGSMSRAFHDLYRTHLIRSPYLHKERPILLNNWEATYFNFNTDKLLDIARDAKDAGIEMLVMDDGWFGNRFDDNRALGDWEVNTEKLPGGLEYLVSEVNKIGLKFGIWMEPEMISPDSDLYRAHPDWAVSTPGKEPSLCRNQLILDLTRKEVFDHTFESIKKVLSSANIEYMKWDMNRTICDIYSVSMPADRQGEFYHRFMLAVYALQEKVLKEFPNLLLENCSSGGGRFDAGMLYYSPQVWGSDDTDAIERLVIQEGNALIYPLSSIGAHVSVCPNHAIGRVTPFETRGHVALAGTFGYELDITKLSKEDRVLIPEQVKMYHKYNSLVREGDYYRLASYSENHFYDAWMVKSKDDKEILVTYVNVIHKPNIKSRHICLQGLNPELTYVDEETGKEYSGDTLMYAGLSFEQPYGDFNSKIVHLIAK